MRPSHRIMFMLSPEQQSVPCGSLLVLQVSVSPAGLQLLVSIFSRYRVCGEAAAGERGHTHGVIIDFLCVPGIFDSITSICTTSVSTCVFYGRCYYADVVTKVLKHSSCWNRPQQFSVLLINLNNY